MPRRSRRVTVRVSDAQHDIWAGAAWEEEISLEEFVRRAADERAIAGAPATDSDKRSARTIRVLIEHYQRMLDVIENAPKGELGWVGLLGCLGHWCQRAGLHEHIF